ncbi:hypothetical protein PoB_005624200 [Plakobranchus ocellatus]|uniref:Uncharacterized protein n=1 Tax=Plakobranchus ocellatus TaxID=259542 RepID=A0AAV4CEH3_9GAST|nr:hypothetical protein PoB_005624200 [Plakobranchus ocellatus]
MTFSSRARTIESIHGYRISSHKSLLFQTAIGGVGGTAVSESALISAGILLSRVRAPPPSPWPSVQFFSSMCHPSFYTFILQLDLSSVLQFNVQAFILQFGLSSVLQFNVPAIILQFGLSSVLQFNVPAIILQFGLSSVLQFNVPAFILQFGLCSVFKFLIIWYTLLVVLLLSVAPSILLLLGSVGGTVVSESALNLQGLFCRGFEPRHRYPGLMEGLKA